MSTHKPADTGVLLYKHRRPDNNEIFYIGIGINNRPWESKHRNRFWWNIVNKYGRPVVEVISTDLTWKDACEWEILFIRHYGRRDRGLGPLVNMTDGGDGTRGPKSEEHKKKIGMANKGKTSWLKGKQMTGKQKENHYGKPCWLKGGHHSDETKEKISMSCKGKPSWINGKHHSDETKRKIGLSVLGKKNKPVNQFSLDGTFIKRWDSMTQIFNELKFRQSVISECCSGKQKSGYGFLWKSDEIKIKINTNVNG